MKSAEIRKKFFDFFVRHNHERVASSSLIPAQDPTLLFANAGMNQFKDLFLGLERRAYKRAVTIQKCVRAGGKHNDLDNVGFTKRHLTFFEMMGNFSFGDYFKNEAINFAWDFITKELSIQTGSLHVSVYQEDQESYDIWNKQIGIPAKRIHKLGAADNFWQMGDTGPCGPCTEIYIDRGPSQGCGEPNCTPGCSCDRFLEFWNLVFMQFERQPDGTDKPLKAKGVDTGMGFERLCAILEDKESVFETDVFARIIDFIERFIGKKYNAVDQLQKAAFNVLADHIRSSTLLIADGCAPSNEGRGYVLRKIIRRAALFAHKLTDDTTLLPKLSHVVVEDMGDMYPELRINEQLIAQVLASEVDKFAWNLVRGKQMLGDYCQQHAATKIVSGDQAFKMYDTFGFPIELIQLIAKENGFTVDMVGFEKEMEKQRAQSRAHGAQEVVIALDESLATEFTGYHELETKSEITALVYNNEQVDQVQAGKHCWVVTKRSPFFIVGGGQVPDNGWLTFTGLSEDSDCRAPQGFNARLEAVQFLGKSIGAYIQAPVDLRVGMPVCSTVDAVLRTNAMKNHTATHMLQAALIALFGNQIKQSGSFVHPDYLRFDFSYHASLSAEDIKRVEDLVNEKIREDIKLDIVYGSMKEAVERGALAFFGDKYNPEKVRIVDIPGFSTELCGGTHVPRTGAIGAFKITESVALAAGYKRIFAVTGPRAIDLFQESFNTVKSLSQEFSVKRELVLDAVAQQKKQLRDSQLTIRALKKQLITAYLPTWESAAQPLATGTFSYLCLEKFGHEELKEIATLLVQKRPGFYFLVSKSDEKYFFLAMVDKKSLSHHPSLDMKQCAAWLKEKFNLRCGGSDTMLQGSVESMPHGLEAELRGWLER